MNTNVSGSAVTHNCSCWRGHRRWPLLTRVPCQLRAGSIISSFAVQLDLVELICFTRATLHAPAAAAAAFGFRCCFQHDTIMARMPTFCFPGCLFQYLIAAGRYPDYSNSSSLQQQMVSLILNCCQHQKQQQQNQLWLLLLPCYRHQQAYWTAMNTWNHYWLMLLLLAQCLQRIAGC